MKDNNHMVSRRIEGIELDVFGGIIRLTKLSGGVRCPKRILNKNQRRYAIRMHRFKERKSFRTNALHLTTL